MRYVLSTLLVPALLAACASDTATAADGGADSGETVLACSDNGRCDQELCDQVPIPAGEFPMGSDSHALGGPPDFFGGLPEYGDETPQHPVRLDAYCIDRYEVSLERYRACVAGQGCPDNDQPDDLHYPLLIGKGQYDPYPIIAVDHEMAAQYCEWIGRRLCTEAEWERAANGPGPAKQHYPWGNSPTPGDGINGNFYTLMDERLVEPVDAWQSHASVEGVHQLVGNVYEWVADRYGPYEVPEDGGVVEDPQGPESGDLRVARGGCVFVSSNYTTTERTTLDPTFGGG